MSEKKTSWDYQRGRYKQISLKFDAKNNHDMAIYEFLMQSVNVSRYIKCLIFREIWQGIEVDNVDHNCDGCMGASFGDCESCVYHAINKDCEV